MLYFNTIAGGILTSSSAVKLKTVWELDPLEFLRLVEAFSNISPQKGSLQCSRLVQQKFVVEERYDAPNNPVGRLGHTKSLGVRNYFDWNLENKVSVVNVLDHSITALLPSLHTMLLMISILCYRFNTWL